MRKLSYISINEAIDLWPSQMVEVKAEKQEIERALMIFCKFATEVDGGITKTWVTRSRGRYRVITEAFQRVVQAIGLDTVKMILATNTRDLYLSKRDKDILQVRNSLLREFGIETYDDLDIRYSIDYKDHFIFWDSILFLFMRMHLA